jgi:hypothetical protein
VEVIQWISRGVIFGDVERYEIMPSVFDFGAFDNGEPETPHDLFEMLDGLRDGMDTPQVMSRPRQRRVEQRTTAMRAVRVAGQTFGGSGHRRFDALFGFIELLASCWFIFLGKSAELLLK